MSWVFKEYKTVPSLPFYLKPASCKYSPTVKDPISLKITPPKNDRFQWDTCRLWYHDWNCIPMKLCFQLFLRYGIKGPLWRIGLCAQANLHRRQDFSPTSFRILRDASGPFNHPTNCQSMHIEQNRNRMLLAAYAWQSGSPSKRPRWPRSDKLIKK